MKFHLVANVECVGYRIEADRIDVQNALVGLPEDVRFPDENRLQRKERVLGIQGPSGCKVSGEMSATWQVSGGAGAKGRGSVYAWWDGILNSTRVEPAAGRRKPKVMPLAECRVTRTTGTAGSECDKATHVSACMADACSGGTRLQARIEMRTPMRIFTDK